MYALKYLDVSSFSTERLTNMDAMFDNCVNLINLDLTSFDTGSVLYMLNTLHVTTENKEDFNKIIEVFNYPPVYPSLGRWEDSIRIDEVKIVEIADELKSGELNCFVWLPGRYSSLQGFSTVWKIPTYYNLVRDKRKFEYLKCYLGERGDLATFRLDEDGENVLLI